LDWSPPTLSSCFSTERSCFGRNGWQMPISKHFSTPHTNSGLTPNLPYNKKSTIGSKLQCVVNDQMPISNFGLHNSKCSPNLGHGLTSLFSHLTAWNKGFQFFPYFKSCVSHKNLLTSSTKRWHTMYTTNCLREALMVQVPASKLELTSFVAVSII
jgi:hypothetical protein